MALNRKFLEALGVEDNAADQILETHSSDMRRIKGELDALKEQADSFEAVKKELDELKAAPEDDYKQRFEDERAAFEQFKANAEAEAAEREKRGLFRALLEDVGIDRKRIDSVLKVSDLSSVSVKDGRIEGAEELSNSIRDEWADFVVKTETEGARVDTPPEADRAAASPQNLSEALHQKYER